MGDLNFNNYNCNKRVLRTNDPLKSFLIFLEQQGLTQMVSEPTHIHGNILDLILSSHPNNILSLDVNDPITITCDHYII